MTRPSKFVLRRCPPKSLSLLLAFCVLGPAVPVRAALACLADRPEALSDTDSSIADLLAGRYDRHSSAFYKWRVRDLRAQLKADPKDSGAYDQLAVALLRLGRVKGAERVLDDKESVKPEHDKTHLIMARVNMANGYPDRALAAYQRAGKINPNALFGDESYRKSVLDYQMERDAANRRRVLPMKNAERRQKTQGDFVDHLVRVRGGPERKTVHRAIRTFSELLRCGEINSPEMLEAFGDLLRRAHPKVVRDSKTLAVKAYLRASVVVRGLFAKEQYRALAKAAAKDLGANAYTRLKKEFGAERGDARKWYSKVRAAESQWLKKQRG